MNDITTPEIMESVSAIEAVQRAEVDIQISTAKRYPRQLSTVKKDMMSFATLDTETAEACFYSLPRGGKTIQGPSVRLAEIAISCYGNLRTGSRVMQVVSDGPTPHVVIQAVAHDLEKNVAITIEKRRRIVGKRKNNGKVDEDDINLATNAGSSIALRDAVFKVVPLALIKPVFEQAKLVAVGSQKTLGERRDKCLVTFSKMGVSKERILQHLNKKSVEDINLQDLEELLGLHNAIKDGVTKIDDAFPEPTLTSSKSESDEIPMGRSSGTPPKKSEKPTEPSKSLQEQLAQIVTESGCDFTTFRNWGAKEKHLVDSETIGSFDDVPDDVAKRLIRARVEMVAQLKSMKEAK